MNVRGIQDSWQAEPSAVAGTELWLACAAELVATQRMEAAEKRKVAEKDARLKQEKERLERERVVRAKVGGGGW